MQNIGRLLSASVEQKNSEQLKQIISYSDIVESDAEVNAIQWVLNFEEVFTTMPTKEQFKESPHSVYWTDYQNTASLESLYNDYFNHNKLRLLKMLVVAKSIDLENGQEVDLNDLKGLIELSNKSGKKVKLNRASNIKRESHYNKTSTDHMPFGLPALDDAVIGIGKQQYALLLAPSGTGKTTFTCFLAVRVARGGGKVLFVPRETTDVQLMEKLDAIVGGFNNMDFGKRTHGNINKLSKYRSIVEKRWQEIGETGGDVVFPNSNVYRPGDIGKMCDEEFEETGRPFDLIIVDGLYLMMPDGSSTGSGSFSADDWKSTRKVSIQLLDLAKEKDLRILATSQMTANSDKSSSKGYTAVNIGYSKGIIEDSAICISLSLSPAQPLNVMEKNIQIGLMKNRNGYDGGNNALLTELNMNFDSMSMSLATNVYGENLAHIPVTIGGSNTVFTEPPKPIVKSKRLVNPNNILLEERVIEKELTEENNEKETGVAATETSTETEVAEVDAVEKATEKETIISESAS